MKLGKVAKPLVHLAHEHGFFFLGQLMADELNFVLRPHSLQRNQSASSGFESLPSQYARRSSPAALN